MAWWKFYPVDFLFRFFIRLWKFLFKLVWTAWKDLKFVSECVFSFFFFLIQMEGLLRKRKKSEHLHSRNRKKRFNFSNKNLNNFENIYCEIINYMFMVYTVILCKPEYKVKKYTRRNSMLQEIFIRLHVIKIKYSHLNIEKL